MKWYFFHYWVEIASDVNIHIQLEPPSAQDNNFAEKSGREINKTSSVRNHHQRAALHWCKGTEITLEPLFQRRKIDVRLFGSLFPPTLESYFR